MASKMKTLQLAKGDKKRSTQKLPRVPLVNRYPEANDILATDQATYLSRPGLRRWVEVGVGPIRKVYSQPGAFDDDLFVVSDTEVYRVKNDGTMTLIYSSFFGFSLTTSVEMVATQSIGGEPAYLYFCAGKELFVYDGLTVSEVVVPDSLGVKSLGLIASYVIVITVQGGDDNGKFYWIQPGENTIDPLDFATAEKSPDPIQQVVVVGDQFWLLGQATTEAWYPTGDPTFPFSPFKGRTFERGAIEGTAVQVKDGVILVDNDGAVYTIAGGMNRISDPSIEERIRHALNIYKVGI